MIKYLLNHYQRYGFIRAFKAYVFIRADLVWLKYGIKDIWYYNPPDPAWLEYSLYVEREDYLNT